jgi:hypothetical protein
VVGLEAKAVLSGFFLPQLNQLDSGILKPLLVEHPGKETAHIKKTTARTSVVRQRLFRMANASFQ